MSGFYGADVEQLRALGRDLMSSAEHLDQILARLSGRVDEVAWHGPDADRFRGEWHGAHSRSVRLASGALRDAAGAASNNAAQQESTSGGSLGGGGGKSFPDERVAGLPAGAGPGPSPEGAPPTMPEPIDGQDGLEDGLLQAQDYIVFNGRKPRPEDEGYPRVPPSSFVAG